jgi:excisionase family DNA binding protein
VVTVEKPEPRLLTIPQAAAFLGRDKDIVAEAVRIGQIPSRRVGSRRLIPMRALLAWLEEGDPT